mmetsp:Transcript_12247/g.45390  ORF Transcript_12247/g.45390 Transcript_12247/m.45390 type:complete len:275 (+) Transcript_12247:1702-2526(+)
MGLKATQHGGHLCVGAAADGVVVRWEDSVPHGRAHRWRRAHHVDVWIPTDREVEIGRQPSRRSVGQHRSGAHRKQAVAVRRTRDVTCEHRSLRCEPLAGVHAHASVPREPRQDRFPPERPQAHGHRMRVVDVRVASTWQVHGGDDVVLVLAVRDALPLEGVLRRAGLVGLHQDEVAGMAHRADGRRGRQRIVGGGAVHQRSPEAVDAPLWRAGKPVHHGQPVCRGAPPVQDARREEPGVHMVLLALGGSRVQIGPPAGHGSPRGIGLEEAWPRH